MFFFSFLKLCEYEEVRFHQPFKMKKKKKSVLKSLNQLKQSYISRTNTSSPTHIQADSMLVYKQCIFRCIIIHVPRCHTPDSNVTCSFMKCFHMLSIYNYFMYNILFINLFTKMLWMLLYISKSVIKMNDNVNHIK